jgi:hypothetical protein
VSRDAEDISIKKLYKDIILLPLFASMKKVLDSLGRVVVREAE